MNRFSKFVVALVIGLNFWLANKVLEVFALVGSEPTVLIGCWFAFTTGELWLLSGITKTKVKEGSKNGERYQPATPGPATKGKKTNRDGGPKWV